MKIQYASGRNQICPLVGSSISGNLSTGNTYYFWIQGRNDIGYNLPSNTTTVTVTAGQGVSLTIVQDCYRSGENWQQFAISASLTNDPSTSTVICVIDAVNTATQEPITLPKIITFTEDAHLNLSRTPTSSLPSGSNLKEGMVRQYSTNGNLYRYHPTSTQTVDDTEVLSASTGRWLRYIDSFNIYVTDTENLINGADTPLPDIVSNDRLLPLKYALDGSPGPHRRLWLVNTSTSADIPSGERVGFIIAVNKTPVSQDFEGLLKIVYEGIADPSTGLLDTLEEDGLTPQKDIGTEKPYSFEASDVIVARNIEPGFAWQCRIFPEFQSYQLKSLPAYQSDVSIYPFIFTESGTYNDASAIIGDCILPLPDTLRRAYPSSALEMFVDSGSGTVDGYFFRDKADTTVINLISDTENQILAINNNGDVYITDELQDFEAQRALVSTQSGESHTGSYSSSTTADSSPILSVSITYPTSIRADYPDVIAGSDRGSFYVDECIFFVRQNSTTIKKFSGFVPTNTTSDSFDLDWSLGTIVGSVNATTFGLWDPPTPVITGSSTSGSDTYEVSCSFSYNGDAISNISHSTSDGCISELSQTLTKSLQDTPYWKSSISSTSSLKSLDSSTLYPYETRALYEKDKITFWTWIAVSLRDDEFSIRPDDLGSLEPGRWVTNPGNMWGNLVDTKLNLQALNTANLFDTEIRIVLESNNPEIWLYLADSTATPSDTILKPDSVTLPNPGRWIQVGGSSGSGGGGGGEAVAANLTYYFDPDNSSAVASDSNSGTSDTAPWQTWSKVVETIESLDLNGGQLTIKLMSSWGASEGDGALPTPLTRGQIIIESHTGGPFNISTASERLIASGPLAWYVFRDLDLGASCLPLTARNGGQIDIGGPSKPVSCDVGVNGGVALVKAETNSTVLVLGDVSVNTKVTTSGTTIFWSEGGLIDFTQAASGPVVTIDGYGYNSGEEQFINGSYTKGCVYASQGRVQLRRPTGQGVNATFVAASGSQLPHGIRYTAENGGVIDTAGAGSTYLPGDQPGVSTTGYYI